jgi:hypothetical protein
MPCSRPNRLGIRRHRAFADTGHSLDKAFECLDLIGWERASALLPMVVSQMVAARAADESTAWRQPVDLISLCEKAGSELHSPATRPLMTAGDSVQAGLPIWNAPGGSRVICLIGPYAPLTMIPRNTLRLRSNIGAAFCAAQPEPCPCGLRCRVHVVCASVRPFGPVRAVCSSRLAAVCDSGGRGKAAFGFMI